MEQARAGGAVRTDFSGEMGERGADSELDAEVRGQLRNLKEGTSQWDIEYARVLEQVKRKRGEKARPHMP